MKDLQTVACFSIFKGNSFGHGGEKRTKQIENLVTENFQYQLIQCPFRYNKIDAVSIKTNIQRIGYLPRVLSLKSNRKNFTLKSLLKESNRFFQQERFLVESEHFFNKANAVIWENTFPDFFHMALLLKERYAKKVIACPHNLESLIPFQRLNWFGNNKIEYLQQELEALQFCDEVFTISEEEEWLLNLFGIRARYLPYYPTGDLFESLRAIRAYRSEHQERNFFLILGSASNPPTKSGMISLLNIISRIVLRHKSDHHFKVAGFGTEQLIGTVQGTNIEILGGIEDNVLADLLKNCKAMIVNQDYTTGALTRIAEMLTAGIPVIVNNGGARTYRRTDGVYIFNSETDLEELLYAALPVPGFPQKPEKKFEGFVESCQSQTGKSDFP